MAKSRTRNRWKHPDRKFCYCFKRPESPFVYTSVFSKREVTDLVWKDSNKEEAMLILEHRINRHLAPHKDEEKTINDISLQFAKVYYSGFTKTNQSRYNSAINLLISSNHKCTDIEAIRNDIIDNLNKLLKTHSSTYVHKMLSNLKRIFNFAVDEEYMTRNPIKTAMFPQGGKKARQLFFKKEELELIIKYCREKRGDEFGDLLELITIIGPRINEPLQGLRTDIDLELMQIMIRDFKRANKETGEEYSPRYIDIEVFNNYSNLSEVLHRILARNNGKHYFKWRSYTRLEKWLRDDMKTLGVYIENRSFHSIRKYAENEFILQGYPISIAAHFFGHDEAVMKKHYLEIMGAKKFKEFTQNIMKNVHTLPN